MIRSVLIFVYIVAVLLVSGLARADLAQINSVGFDSKHYMMHVRGNFTNTCQQAPRPEVLQYVSDEQHDIVYLGVQTSENSLTACAEALGGRFDLVFDIRTLNLPFGKELVFKFQNTQDDSIEPVVARIDHEAFGLDFASIQLSGLLVEIAAIGINPTPSYAVVSEAGEVVRLKTIVDLSEYINSQVAISGIPLGHTADPALGSVEIGFEAQKSLGKMSRLVFATEVSSTPLQ